MYYALIMHAKTNYCHSDKQIIQLYSYTTCTTYIWENVINLWFPLKFIFWHNIFSVGYVEGVVTTLVRFICIYISFKPNKRGPDNDLQTVIWSMDRILICHPLVTIFTHIGQICCNFPYNLNMVTILWLD